MDDFLYCFHAGCTTVRTEVKLKGACKHIAVEQGPGASSVLSAQATGLALFYIGEKYSVSQAGGTQKPTEKVPSIPRLGQGTTP